MASIQLSDDEYAEFKSNIKTRQFWMYDNLLWLSDEGKVTKTQVEIAERFRIHPTTVHKWIKELNEIYVKGHPLVKTVRDGETNVYYVLTVISARPNTTKPNGCVTSLLNDLEDSKDLKKDVTKPVDNHPCATATSTIKYFCSKYHEQFGEKYIPVWSRDTKNVRDKISKNFEPDAIQGTIDVIMRLYTKMWQKPGYPRPTIGGMTAFLFQQAQAYMNANQKEAAQQESQEIEIQAVDGQDILDLYDKKWGL